MSDLDPVEAVTAFMVVVTPDGGLDVFTTSMPTVNMKRSATLADIEQAGMRLSVEAGRTMLLKSLQAEPETSPSQVVSEALSKRSGS